MQLDCRWMERGLQVDCSWIAIPARPRSVSQGAKRVRAPGRVLRVLGRRRMNRRNGGIGFVIAMALGFAIGTAIVRYAYGDLNPGIVLGVGTGMAVGLVLTYFFRGGL